MGWTLEQWKNRVGKKEVKRAAPSHILGSRTTRRYGSWKKCIKLAACWGLYPRVYRRLRWLPITANGYRRSRCLWRRQIWLKSSLHVKNMKKTVCRQAKGRVSLNQKSLCVQSCSGKDRLSKSCPGWVASSGCRFGYPEWKLGGGAPADKAIGASPLIPHR